jgi:hypothetical protein
MHRPGSEENIMLGKFLFRAAVVTATLAAPAVSLANVRAQTQVPTPSSFSTQTSFGRGSLGSGMIWGNDPSHVATPGRTSIDLDSRGPVNDVDVVAPGSGNTKATVTPRPVH